LAVLSASIFACDNYTDLTIRETNGNNVVEKSSVAKVWVRTDKTIVFFNSITIDPNFSFNCKKLVMEKVSFLGRPYEDSYAALQREFLSAVSSGVSIGFSAASSEGKHKIESFNGYHFAYAVGKHNTRVNPYRK
jgi:hypothetical protein